MSCRDLDSLWKEYFRDPSQFSDTRKRKRAPSSPDFRHKQTREPLWIESSYNLPRFQEELRRSGPKHFEFCLRKGRVKDELPEVNQVFQESASLLNLIKTCGIRKDLCEGSRIHADILKKGLLKKDIYFGTALLHMYAKCGALAKAQEVFDELPSRDVASWNALLSGYAQHGLGDEALNCFDQMQDEGLSPNAITFVCLLKACVSIGSAKKGEEIHAELRRQGLLKNNILLGTALVDMYAKCGALAKAQRVLGELPARDITSWNALIAGYAQHGLNDDVLRCFERMQDDGLSPDSVTFVCILKVYGSIGAVEMGEEMHIEVSRQGLLEKNIVLGTAVVDMYAKCGVLAKAQEVFNELRGRDVCCWNALLGGYSQQGLSNEALKCFEQMQNEGLYPNATTFVCVLKACGSIAAMEKGEEIHAEVNKQGLLAKSIVLGNALVDMYAKCGALAKAQEVFDELPARDVASWNALIAGYAQQGLGGESLSCYKRMRDEGVLPDAVTFVCILKACSSIGAVEEGEAIHVEVNRLGLVKNHVVLGNALVDMYVKCGALAKALEVFDELPARDVASWNVLIAGYAQYRLSSEALNCFGRMQEEGISPNTVTFVCILKACSSLGVAEKCKQLHSGITRQVMLEKSVILGNALVDMYAKCGALAIAQEVFDALPEQDVTSWNVLIAGYVQHGVNDEALSCFCQMQDEGISPDVVTFLSILTACSGGAAEKGEEIHAEIDRRGLLEEHNVLGTALVDMYAKCGMLEKAQKVFDELPVRDVVSWTALIAGYTQNGLGDKALICFGWMRDEGIFPDAATFVSSLKACGNIGAVEKGEELHAEVVRQGLLKNHIMLGYALVDMYAKCGALANAEAVFDKLPARDVISWTTLIAGYAQLGKVRSVFHAFSRMIGDHIQPNMVTFVVLLTACSHAGLVEEGQMYLGTMSTVYGIIPTLEHYTCVADLFSRAGHFDKAISIIEKVPPSNCLLLWSALLGACRNWANAELGRWAFEHVIRLDEKYTAAYVCMSNISAAAGMAKEENMVKPLTMKMEDVRYWDVVG